MEIMVLFWKDKHEWFEWSDIEFLGVVPVCECVVVLLKFCLIEVFYSISRAEYFMSRRYLC